MKEKKLCILRELVSKKAWLSLFNWVYSLFWAKEVFYVAIILVVPLLIGVITAVLSVGDGKVWTKTFAYMFSADKASENCVAIIVFLGTWLVSGLLVSVVVGQLYKNIGGGFRRWKRLVKNHIVVLGWDNGVLAELARESADCYVVTKQDVVEISKLLSSAGIKNYYVYKGDYDDKEEWLENLQIKEALKVIIAGEKDEDAHDARVRILFDQINVLNLPNVTVNVHDFGLAHKLSEKDSKTYENFHMKWAQKLWSMLIPDESEAFDLYVIGFGAMGKAVTLKAIDDYKPCRIIVSDNDDKKLEEEKVRFTAQFGNQEKYKDKVEFMTEWSETLENIGKLKGSEEGNTFNNIQQKVVIIVAKKRSEKGLYCMMDIISQLGNSVCDKIKLALDQEVDGYSVNADSLEIVSKVPVQLFGMKKGC